TAYTTLVPRYVTIAPCAGVISAKDMAIVLLFFILSVISDGILFSAMEKKEPELYEKLGSPGFLSLSMNPLVIIKYWIFILSPNPLPEECDLNSLLWVSRICVIGFIGSIFLSLWWQT
ncbi:hypothetical protein, partial [Marinimicrobium sp. ABcell2]|uniref:hypothetical protein n=1 Tax=Marinimicrobium sp. ABcell2 TaxID=3069751 RepID=UPI0027B7903B